MLITVLRLAEVGKVGAVFRIASLALSMPFRMLYGSSDTASDGKAMDPALLFMILSVLLVVVFGPVVAVLGFLLMKRKLSAGGREQDGRCQCGAGPCRGFDMPTCVPLSAAILIVLGMVVFGVIRLVTALLSEEGTAGATRAWESAQGGLAFSLGCAYGAVVKFRFWNGKGLGDKCDAWLSKRIADPTKMPTGV